MIKYLGSKRKLIKEVLRALGPAEGRTLLDLFSGTARVGHAAKKAGFSVVSNDQNTYAKTIAECYVVADAKVIADDATKILRELNSLKGKPGYFTERYSKASRYFHPKNGARIDAIRLRIDELDLEPTLKSVILTSLMEAADRVDSTCGVQMAYLKEWAKRAHKDLELRLPELVPNRPTAHYQAHQGDALEHVKALAADVTYLDPPYNQHSYLGNYHIWETLTLNDQPETYGIAQKRIDCKTRKSAFNSKRAFKDAFSSIVQYAPGNQLVVSFNNEGYLSTDELTQVLSTRGEVERFDIDYKRYVGAQIGVHNLKGEKVGQVSHLRNLEHIFVVKVNTPLRVPS